MRIVLEKKNDSYSYFSYWGTDAEGKARTFDACGLLYAAVLVFVDFEIQWRGVRPPQEIIDQIKRDYRMIHVKIEELS